MNTEVITTLEDFLKLEHKWNELLEASSFCTPFQLFHWQRSVITYTEEHNSLFYVCVYESGDLIGIAPLVRDRSLWRRVLRFVGGAEDTCDYKGCLIRSGKEDDFYPSFFDTLRVHINEWDELALTEIPTGFLDPENMASRFKSGGFQVSVRQTNVSCPLPLPSAWNEYLDTLPSKFRHTIENRNRALGKLPGFQQEDLATTDRWEDGLRALFSFHQERWTAKGERGIFAGENVRQMHNDIVSHLREEGKVRMLAFSVAGEIIAVNYSFCIGKTTYAYLTSYSLEEKWNKYGLGIAIYRSALQYAIESGQTIYDFLRGAEPYKMRFGASPVSNLDLHIFHSSPQFLLFNIITGLIGLRRLVPAPIKQKIKQTIRRA